MCNGVEVEVRMHGRQGCLVACVQMEPGTEKGVQTHQTQPDIAPVYRTYRTNRTQSPHLQSQNETPRYLTEDGFLLMYTLFFLPTEVLLVKATLWIKTLVCQYSSE